MQTLRCDILILGCGPAGLAAALAAASCGKQVVILDDIRAPAGRSGARVRWCSSLPWRAATGKPLLRRKISPH